MAIKLLFLLFVFALTSCSQRNKEKITELSQLKYKRIAILTGSAGDIAARKAFPEANFLDNVASADAAYSVKIGKADAFVFDKSVLTKIAKKDDALIVLEKPVAQVEIAIAFNKGRTELLTDINNVLKELKSSGTLKTMKEKWIDTEYQSVPELPNIQADSKNGILKVGTCSTVEPMTFIYNNIVTGFDIELALRLGEKLGKKIEIVDLAFESLVPALQSGKIDLALSNFNVTEERKKFISFSDPYFVNDISVLVNK
jgi:polar amino acid transport system substrate-binding protein